MIPKECNMPDLAKLKSVTSCFLASCLVGTHKIPYGSKTSTLYKRIVNLIDKAIYEYLMAREAMVAQVDSKNNWKGELHVLRLGNHLETCICTIVVIFNLLDRVEDALLQDIESSVKMILAKKNTDSEKMEIIRELISKTDEYKMSYANFLKKLSKKSHVKNIRNTIMHIDERIMKGLMGSIMITVNEKGSEATISAHVIKFRDLSQVLEDLHIYIQQNY